MKKTGKKVEEYAGEGKEFRKCAECGGVGNWFKIGSNVCEPCKRKK